MDSGRWRAPAAQGPVRATLRLPGSKSITNRALILAALSDSPSVVRGVLRARDTSLATGALHALGCTVVSRGDAPPYPPMSARGDDPAAGPDDLVVTPLGSQASTPPGTAVSIDVGNAGTVMRFLPAVAALTPATVSFDGDPRARERPVGALLSALGSLGVSVDDGGRGALPFTIHGTGSVAGGPVTLDASGSSQLVSGLLLAAPRFTRGVEVRHSGPPVPSLPHIEMTVRMLRDAGATVEVGAGERPDHWVVRPGRLNLGDFTVEPDLSNAGPFLAAALVTGGSVTIRDWPAASLQAADAILDVITQLGGSVSRGGQGLTVTGSGVINGITADLRDVPELCLPLTSVAALASGPSTFTGVGHTRMQETDRLAAITKEINALGGDVTEFPDGLSVTPRPLRVPAGHAFDSYNDHRMVMAAAVLGLGVPGIEVLNVATVGKTFPGFTALWEGLVRGGES
ncbi:MAG TPA: 3-phosphoshikimate 1-carboxyvinyltransferase [Trebonia sp.]|nr:3-phosphoshikimate 1-carboxyvinyltransferase [Trebonia sp.]